MSQPLYPTPKYQPSDAVLNALVANGPPGTVGLALLADETITDAFADLGNPAWDRYAGHYKSNLYGDNSGNLTTSNTLHACYIGRALRNVLVKHVDFIVTVVGAGAQTAEVGLFSSPLPPHLVGQTLTCLIADTAVDVLNGLVGLKRNTTGFNADAGYLVLAGTELWVGLRTALVTTQPTVRRLFTSGMGDTCTKAGAGVLTAGSTYAMTPDSTTAQAFQIMLSES